jgi:ADP-heptose:LPS heptosyltransferase
MDSIKPNTYIINWKGNPNNPHEKHNRMMNLINAFPLFKIQSSNIHWLVISKDLTKQEHKILKKHNISYIGNRIDKQKAYYDTISILQHKNISGVISTDTSLPHLSLSLGIKTYVLLTLGCEWRWTQDEKTNWYPDAILLRQKIHGDWRDPIQKLVNLISKSITPLNI